MLLMVADNQKNATLVAEKQGWCEIFDARNQVDFSDLSRRVLALWNDTKRLEVMSDRAYQVQDPYGAERVCSAIYSLLMEPVR